MKRRFRAEPWLITAAFVVPFTLALTLLYGGFAAELLGRTNNPERALIDPPVPLGMLAEPARTDNARYRWALIYARMLPCDDACMTHLVRLQQVHLALGRHGERVQRVYLGLHPETGGGAPMPQQPMAGLAVGPAADEQQRILLGLPGHDPREGRIFIRDPLGNLVASYPGGAAQRGLLRDIRRLLDTSWTG
jgi:hypothetical protein